MHHDWGLILAIVGLVLMLPANLLANFLTPILKNWWALRSRNSLDQRIEKLESWLAKVETYPLLTTPEEYILRAFNRLASLVGIAVQFGGVVTIVLSDWIADIHHQQSNWELISLALFGMASIFTLVSVFNVLNGGFIEARTEEGRIRVQEEIAKLMEKRRRWK